jgi:hypothetical protein
LQGTREEYGKFTTDHEHCINTDASLINVLVPACDTIPICPYHKIFMKKVEAIFLKKECNNKNSIFVDYFSEKTFFLNLIKQIIF